MLKADERRRAPRVKTSARCWLERKSVTLFGTVLNVSATGLFLNTPVSIEVGRQVALSLDLGNGIVSALGSVVWANAQPRGRGAPGLGIEFAEITAGEALLRDFIEQQIEQGAFA